MAYNSPQKPENYNVIHIYYSYLPLDKFFETESESVMVSSYHLTLSFFLRFLAFTQEHQSNLQWTLLQKSNIK